MQPIPMSRMLDGLAEFYYQLFHLRRNDKNVRPHFRRAWHLVEDRQPFMRGPKDWDFLKDSFQYWRNTGWT